MQVKIQDAKTGILLKDKFRWVDCKLIEGDISKMTNHHISGGYVVVEYMRAYYVKDKIVEKLNQERIYYANQIKEK